ncbi:MAG TPA: DNA repair exonuclease [Gemmatimonadaceae bacterium]|nr:DNA repair exonuclease [Gemmatimonadaceae bacterium]
MRLVHLSDLHLGFRQYQRLTPRGLNQREWDVADAFRRAIDGVIAIAPELVVVGGDVFHQVRPTNAAILQTFRQFTRLRAALPETVVVLIAGNHDTPRTSESGSILKLFAELGLHVVDAKAERLAFPERSLSILAVPDVAGAERPALVPDPSARFNVLLLHGEVEGIIPAAGATAERTGLEISLEELSPASWDYVALGHYHVYREVAPNAYYSGSIEYTSANSWGELHEERQLDVPGKGFVERDLATGRQLFHHLPPARALVDLPPVEAAQMSSADVDAAIRQRVEQCPGGIDDKIVRLVVRNCPRHIARALDHKALREYKRRAMHFHLDARRPEVLRLSASGAPGRRASLFETVQQRLQERPLPSDVAREPFVEAGVRYLREADVSAAGATGIGAAAATALDQPLA